MTTFETELESALNTLDGSLLQSATQAESANQSFEAISKTAEELAKTLDASLRKSLKDLIVDGEEFSSVLRKFGQSFLSDTVTNLSENIGQGLGNMAASALGSAIGGAPPSTQTPMNLSVNVSTPDYQSFQHSKSQFATEVLRLLNHGRKNL